MGEPACRVFDSDGRQRARPIASTSASRTRAPSLRTRALILLKASSSRVQIRRGVGGQEHEVCSPGFDELSDPMGSMRPEPISSTTTCPFSLARGPGIAPRKPREGQGVGGPLYGHADAHIAPSRVIAAMRVVFLDHGFEEPSRRPSSLSEPWLSNASWRCESRFHQRTLDASHREAGSEPPPQTPRLLVTLGGGYP
jgi:hypothetical protein